MKENLELLLFQKYLETKNEWRLSKFSTDKKIQSKLENEMLEIKKEVKEYEDNQSSTRSKNAIYDQIQSYIDSINMAIPGLKLLRDQSMMHRDTLFGNFLKDIYTLLKDEIYGIHKPIYLFYTTDQKEIEIGNTVEIENFREFLENEKKELFSLPSTNFIVLENYYEELRDRIIKKFGIKN
ncbi:TPA: hypothetical protein ACG0AG_001042 [Elizabethkingia anophelis]